jgi:aspartate carbamoyltransferase catalytic subunit
MTFPHRHLLGIEQLRPSEITTILDLAEDYVALNRGSKKHSDRKSVV